MNLMNILMVKIGHRSILFLFVKKLSEYDGNYAEEFEDL